MVYVRLCAKFSERCTFDYAQSPQNSVRSISAKSSEWCTFDYAQSPQNGVRLIVHKVPRMVYVWFCVKSSEWCAYDFAQSPQNSYINLPDSKIVRSIMHKVFRMQLINLPDSFIIRSIIRKVVHRLSSLTNLNKYEFNSFFKMSFTDVSYSIPQMTGVSSCYIIHAVLSIPG